MFRERIQGAIDTTVNFLVDHKKEGAATMLAAAALAATGCEVGNSHEEVLTRSARVGEVCTILTLNGGGREEAMPYFSDASTTRAAGSKMNIAANADPTGENRVGLCNADGKTRVLTAMAVEASQVVEVIDSEDFPREQASA